MNAHQLQGDEGASNPHRGAQYLAFVDHHPQQQANLGKPKPKPNRRKYFRAGQRHGGRRMTHSQHTNQRQKFGLRKHRRWMV